MTQLSAQQARDLAESFSELAQAVGNFSSRHRADPGFSQNQRDAILSFQMRLLNDSRDFTAQAIQITLQDLQPTLDQISGATSRMNAAIQQLEDINKVIGIASAAVGLGAAIITGNPAAIVSALNDAVNVAS